MLAKKLLMLLASIFCNNTITYIHISNFTIDKKKGLQPISFSDTDHKPIYAYIYFLLIVYI